MPIVVIKTAQVDERRIKGDQIIRSQTAGLDLGNGFHLPFRVGLGNRAAYQPGEYDIDPRSFALNQYGDLVLGKYVDLLPLTAKPAKAA